MLCEEVGLWGTAHSDGTVELRLLPTGAPDERYTLELQPGKPVPSLNIPQFRAPFMVCVSPLLLAEPCTCVPHLMRALRLHLEIKSS